MITRLIVYFTLGVLCNALGFTFSSTEFWCFMGLFWCADIIGRGDGFRNGLVQGMDTYRRMNSEQRADIDKILREEK